jgi:uncharacterized protein (UPF0332 family)
MSLARAHLEKAVEGLRAAEKLFQDGYYEDAVSRAYYAMYHAARAALSIVNVFPKTHEGVVAEFGRKFVLTGIFEKELGKNLAHAKAARETYEYTIATTVLKPEAEAILRNAQDFVKTVKKYLEKIGVLVGAMH